MLLDGAFLKYDLVFFYERQYVVFDFDTVHHNCFSITNKTLGYSRRYGSLGHGVRM